MYNVSDQYRAAMKTLPQYWDLYGTIGAARFGRENIAYQHFKIDNPGGDGDYVQIGSATAATLTATFVGIQIDRYGWKGREIRPYFGLQVSGGNYEYIPMGVYTIAEATWTQDGTEVVAYDALAKLDRPYYRHAGKISPYTLILSAEDRCCVEIGQSRDEIHALPNGNTDLYYDPKSDATTYRDTLAWLAQYMGCFLTAGRDGKIYFRQYGRRVVDELGPQHRLSGCQFADYETRYSAVSLETETGTKTWKLANDDALLYELGKNPLLQDGSNNAQERRCRTILGALQAVRYVPFEASSLCDPAYDLGDVLKFSDGIADGTKLYCITAWTFNFNAAYCMMGTGANPSIARAKSATDQAVRDMESDLAASKDLYVVRNESAVSTTVSGGPILCLDAVFSASDGARVRADAMIRMTAQTPEDIVDNTRLTARWQIDSAWITAKDTHEIYCDGPHVLTLIEDHTLSWGGNHSIQIWLASDGGAVSVPALGAALYLSGDSAISDEIEDWEPEPEEPYLLYVEITTPPKQTEYAQGERANYAGLIVTGFWSDGTSADVTADCHFTPADGAKLETIGPVQVTALYYAGEEAHWAYTDLIVSEAEEPLTPAILSIYVAHDPAYGHAPGTALDYYGVRIMATREDGADFEVTDECTYSPAEGTAWEAGRAVVAVTLLDNGETYTTSFIVPEMGIEEEEDPAIDPGVTPGPADPDDPVGPWYDPARIVIQTNEETGAVSFALDNPYTYTGTNQDIDEGACAVVEIPTDGFQRIETLTIGE